MRNLVEINESRVVINIYTRSVIMKKTPKETNDETKFKTYVEDDGNEALKLNVWGRRGWPDRLVVFELGGHFFIEFKRRGKGIGKRRGEKLQLHIHKKLRGKGHNVYTVDTCEEAVEIYEYEKEKVRKEKRGRKKKVSKEKKRRRKKAKTVANRKTARKTRAP